MAGCDLEIYEAFPGFENGPNEGPKIILGKTDDRTPYSLVENRCRGVDFTIGQTMTDKRPIKSRFHATYLLAGKHLNDYADFVICEARVSFSYLNQWMWETNINRADLRTGLIQWEKYKPELVANIPGCKILKELVVNEMYLERPAKGYEITNQWYITFEFDQPQNISVIWETIRKFQRLIAFSSQRPILIRELLVKFPNENTIYPLWLKQPLEDNTDEDYLGGLDYLFRFVDHEHHMSYVIQKWYEIYENFGAILDSYLAIFYSEIVFTEAEFLTYAQSLEALHRGMESLEILPKSIADEIRTKMLAVVPEEHLEFISSKLSHIHEASFLNRIKDMYEMAYTPISTTSIRINDELFKKIRDTRNFYTHFDRRLRDKILKGSDLYNTNRALNIVLIVYILKKLGFSTPEIAAHIKRIV